MKELKLLSLLLVATLFVQNATAGLLLPYSSHYQGRSYFPENDNNVTGFVDFAVYDTLATYGNEWEGAGLEAPGYGRFIYAYQIFCGADSNAIGSFTIMGKDDPPTSHNLTGINTINFLNPWETSQLMIEEAIEPTSTNVNPGETRATWYFWGSTSAILIHGEYSWFLIFSSDNDWTQGKYQLGTASDGVPITLNPEPCTLALLGLGSTILLAKRRKHRFCSH